MDELTFIISVGCGLILLAYLFVSGILFDILDIFTGDFGNEDTSEPPMRKVDRRKKD